MRIPTKEQLAELLSGLNVKELAKAAGVSTKTVYRYRKGVTRPSLETLEVLEPILKEARRKARRATAEG